jgi:hypothetical protein
METYNTSDKTQTQQEINEVFKKGIKKTETFNGVTVVGIEARISTKQSLKFASFLSSIAKSKGRTSGTINEKTLSIIEDWYEINDSSITISHIYGRSRSSKTNYHTITWEREL